jgi:hypothetical protein
MNKQSRKGILMIIGGLALGIGYYLYVLHEISSKAATIRVSLMLPAVALLLVAVGVMQLLIGDKTTELMSFNTKNLSKRDILIASIVGLAAIAVAVGVTLFLNAHGYR